VETAEPAVPGTGLRAGREALLLPGLTAEAARLLADTVPELVDPELSGPFHRAALIAAGVTEIGLGELTARLSGLARPPAGSAADPAGGGPGRHRSARRITGAADRRPYGDRAAHRRHGHRPAGRGAAYRAARTAAGAPRCSR